MAIRSLLTNEETVAFLKYATHKWQISASVHCVDYVDSDELCMYGTESSKWTRKWSNNNNYASIVPIPRLQNQHNIS